MKIKSIRIENFRSFRDETFALNKHSCFIGPNGAGKSSILAALNVLFRDQSSPNFDTAKLQDEDYFCKNTANPVRITITLDDLNQAAQAELSDYVRQNDEVYSRLGDQEIRNRINAIGGGKVGNGQEMGDTYY